LRRRAENDPGRRGLGLPALHHVKADGRSEQGRAAAADDCRMDAGRDRRDDRVCRPPVPGGRLMAVVASTRKSSWRSRVKQSALVLLSAAAFVAGCWLNIAPAQAQMTFPKRPAAAQTKP